MSRVMSLTRLSSGIFRAAQSEEVKSRRVFDLMFGLSFRAQTQLDYIDIHAAPSSSIRPSNLSSYEYLYIELDSPTSKFPFHSFHCTM